MRASRRTRARRPVRVLAVGAVVWAALAVSLPAAADDVDFAELVQRATSGAADLETVEAVNGIPVDIAEILGDEPAARARTIAAFPVDDRPQPDVAEARQRAASIISRPEYAAEAQPEAPLWAQAVQWVLDRLPEGTGRVFGILGLLVLIAVAVLALTAGRRQVRRGRVAADMVAESTAGTSPRQLDQAADEATSRGDYATAVRLRFAATVLRLRERGTLREAAPTSGAVRRAFRSADVDRLTATFDAVAYGDAPASASDATDAAETWPRVLAAST